MTEKDAKIFVCIWVGLITLHVILDLLNITY